MVQSDFDQGTFHGIAPGWSDNSGWADVDVEYAIDRSKAHRGGSQLIHCSRFGTGAVQFVRSGVPIVQGRRYRIRLWMKGNVGSSVELLLRKRGGPYTTYAAKGFKISDAWREYEFVAISPVTDDSVFLMIKFTSTGRIWIDDLVMTDVTDEPTSAVSTVMPRRNLLANGSFEVGLDHWGIQIREADYRYELPVYLSMTTPRTTGAKSKEGRKSLEVDVPAHGRMTLTSPYVKVNAGQAHTLSFWAVADRPRMVYARMASGHHGSVASYDRGFVVDQTWKRYEVSARLQPAPEDAYYALIETTGEGRIWIDGVQLKEGQSNGFESRSEIEIGFDRQNAGTLFEVDKPIGLKAIVWSGDSFEAVDVTIRSADYHGNVSILWSGTLRTEANRGKVISFSHPSVQPGYFRISAEIRQGGNLLDSSQMAIGVIRSMASVAAINSPFGNHARFSKPRLQEARQLGVGWLRMHPPSATKWFLVEPRKGDYVFHDEAIRYAKSLGFELLGMLETTPRWASSAPASEEDFRLFPPADMRDWERYVYETVRHYRGVIDHWEVWNEPTSPGYLLLPPGIGGWRRAEVYSELLKTAYRAAKRANPEAVIVGGCPTAQPPVKWFEKVFASGAYDSMDVLSYHYYTDGRPGDALDIPTGQHIADLRALERKYNSGSVKPIWETESGIMYTATAYDGMIEVAPGYLIPGREAAAFVVRNYVHLLSNGVEKWFYYGMLPSLRSDRFEGSGFHEWDGSPRPMALAYANLAWILGSGRYVRSTRLDNNVTQVEFQDNARTIMVLWKKEWTGNQKLLIRVPIPTSHRSIDVFDIMGKALTAKLSGGVIQLELGRDPVYVVLTDPTSNRNKVAR